MQLCAPFGAPDGGERRDGDEHRRRQPPQRPRGLRYRARVPGPCLHVEWEGGGAWSGNVRGDSAVVFVILVRLDDRLVDRPIMFWLFGRSTNQSRFSQPNGTVYTGIVE